jgi:hypothetical protein
LTRTWSAWKRAFPVAVSKLIAVGGIAIVQNSPERAIPGSKS